MTSYEVQTRIATALDVLTVEVMLATRKVDAMILSDSLRELSSQCERLAGLLPAEPTQRRTSARNAALARWKKSGVPRGSVPPEPQVNLNAKDNT